MTAPSPKVEQRHREGLTDREQMIDAQNGCVPCKLCGGKAAISDAGIGAGYYVQCENSRTFRDSKGCLLDGRRLGGWAYNVMEWWNRLHADATFERDLITPSGAPSAGGEWPDIDVQAQTYRDMHETAVGMGYPSLTEALENLDELRSTPPGDAEGRASYPVEERAFHVIKSSVGDDVWQFRAQDRASLSSIPAHDREDAYALAETLNRIVRWHVERATAALTPPPAPTEAAGLREALLQIQALPGSQS